MSDNHVMAWHDPTDSHRWALLSVDQVIAELQRLAAEGTSEEVLDRLFAQVYAYQESGHARQVITLLDRRQDIMTDDALDPVALGWLLNEHGTAFSAVGEHAAASASFHRMAELGRRSDDDDLVSTAEQNLGIQAHLRRDYASARLHTAEAARRKLASGDTYAAMQVLINLTALDLDEGRLVGAEQTLVELQRVLRRVGAPHLSMTLNGNLALLAVQRHDFALAERHARRSLHYARRSGDEAGEVRGLHTIGNIRLEAGDHRNALRWYRRALRLAARLDLPPLLLVANQGMVAVLLRTARYREATAHLLTVRKLAHALGNREGAAHALADYGAVVLATVGAAEATPILKEALREVRLLPDTEWEVRVLANLAQAARLGGDHHAADNLIEEALGVLPEEQISARANLLRDAARVRLDDAATFEQGVTYLQRALDIEASLDEDHAARAWAFGQAAAELAQRSERRAIAASLPFYNRALHLYESGGEEAMAFHIRNDRAIALTALGRYEEAFADYRHCLAIAERRNDRVMTQQAAGNLGEALNQSGEATEALPHLERALALTRELGDIRGQADNLGSLGLALGALGQVAAAEEYFAEALALGRTAALPTAEAVALGGLALVAFERAEYALARERYAAAAAIEARLGDHRHLAESMAGHVEALAALGETADMEAEAQRLVDLAQAIGAEELASSALGRAARWYLERGDLAEAADLYEASIASALALFGDSEEAEQRATEALIFATLLALTHARDATQDGVGLLARVVEQVEARYPGSGPLVSSTVEIAREVIGRGSDV